MAFSTVVDDDLAVFQPSLKPGMPRITAGFNAALIAYQAVVGFLTFLGSDRAKGFPMAGILLSSTLDLARFVVVMLFTAWFLRAFWHRLISTLAPVWPIDFQEALSIALMASLLFGR